MGRQQKIKARRRQARFLQKFVNDVVELNKTNPKLKELWEEVLRLRSSHAPADKLHAATQEFSKEFARIKGVDEKSKESRDKI